MVVGSQINKIIVLFTAIHTSSSLLPKQPGRISSSSSLPSLSSLLNPTTAHNLEIVASLAHGGESISNYYYYSELSITETQSEIQPEINPIKRFLDLNIRVWHFYRHYSSASHIMQPKQQIT